MDGQGIQTVKWEGNEIKEEEKLIKGELGAEKGSKNKKQIDGFETSSQGSREVCGDKTGGDDIFASTQARATKVFKK